MNIRNEKEALLVRLETLHRFLEAEGWYVKANTVWLAIQHIKGEAA